MSVYEQDIINTLMDKDDNFRRLHKKHQALDVQVQEVHDGAVVMDDFSLEKLKKQKLMLKDQMTQLIQAYHGEVVA